ncbi:MAG: AAA family ATPase, partial [Candidatus Methanomethylophilaceae archaeon]
MEVQRTRYLSLLEAARGKTDLVKIITGMRRSGKSTLLKQFRSTLSEEDNIISMNESHIDEIPDWSGLKKAIHEEIVNNRINYVFIDEIQNVSGWER